MFTRKHGHSPAPYASLNLSYGVGDTRTNVQTNRQLVKHTCNINTLVSAKQVHSNRVCRVGKLTEDTELESYDALITDAKGVGLLIQQADCQAVLLHDPLKEVIGAIHCGWKGSSLNIIGETIDRMTLAYGSDPSTMKAVISPSLGPCCAEFIHYRDELPAYLHSYQSNPGHFNFWEISKSQLKQAGLRDASIEVTAICTVCNRDFFSYRRSKKQGSEITGRQGSVICL